MKKLIKIVLIAILVFPNISVPSAFAKDASEKEEVNLYLPNSNEDLVLYKDKELEVELTSIKNDSPALLLEEIDTTNSSLVEVETTEKEKIKGYINSEAVLKEAELIEEYKLYADKAKEDISIYIDEALEDTLYELEDGTSVLVKEADLETSKEEELDYVYITLNPEVEEIPEELEETFENVDEIQGFVHRDKLVALEEEDEFLLERKTQNEVSEEDATNDLEESVDEEASDNETSEESEVVVEEEQAQAEDESEEPEEEESDESEELEESEEAAKNEKEDMAKERSTMQSNVQETSTSRLGHIRGGNRLIYEEIGGESIKASAKHRDAVYYIKRQAKAGSETYYLLSTEPSSIKGVVGWMKAKDVSTHTHAGVTKSSKQLLIKGTGKATSKAWGGSKDSVHDSMSSFKGNTLDVNLTEKVGNNTWYRGKINGAGANIWLHSSQTEDMPNIKEANTSRLGHIRGGNRLIYETVGGKSIKASAKHRDAVYYIKRQAKVGSQNYYLLSTSPSATRGVLGWMKAGDVSTHTHTGVTKSSKQLIIKGTGKATSKAWGGSKDKVHASMKSYQGDFFNVNLTEKVGKNTWYRGKINGQGANVWLHSSHTEEFKINESSTSRLGHIRGGNRIIYEEIGGQSIKASAKHHDAVYYIKREAKVGSETYYLLSTSPSATRGVVGWMKSEDLSTHTHVGIDKKTKQFLIKGTGKATSKAWGGNKDTIHTSMKSFQGEIFDVNLTEKVGNNTWYRGKLNDKGVNIWLHSSQVVKDAITETDYGLSINDAIAMQIKRSPFHMSGSHGFIAKSRVNSNNQVIGTGLSNVRTMPQTSKHYDNKIIKTLKGGTKITPISEIGRWYAIEVGGSRKVSALPEQVEERLNPDSHLADSINKFQFLDLRKRTGLTASEMNRELYTRGILKGQGKAFREASIEHGINEMYLIVHARLETGNGTSALSNGTHEVGLDSKGKAQLVKTASDRVRLKKIKKTYNMFGIGAIDSNPAVGGATRAYNEGWFTPEAAIVGGAAWIKENYIYNIYGQHTLYKMRWNPDMLNGSAWKQYATDIDWAIKQAKLIHGVYNKTDRNKVLSFDTPTYK